MPHSAGCSDLPPNGDSTSTRSYPAARSAFSALDRYRHFQCQYQSAIEWVQDTDTDWLFSFTNICDLLGFDPEYLRETLLKRENKYVKPARPKILSLAAMAAQH